MKVQTQITIIKKFTIFSNVGKFFKPLNPKFNSVNRFEFLMFKLKETASITSPSATFKFSTLHLTRKTEKIENQFF